MLGPVVEMCDVYRGCQLSTWGAVCKVCVGCVPCVCSVCMSVYCTLMVCWSVFVGV